MEKVLAETSKISLVQKMAIFSECPGIAESFTDAFALFVADFNRTRETKEDFHDVIRRAYKQPLSSHFQPPHP